MTAARTPRSSSRGLSIRASLLGTVCALSLIAAGALGWHAAQGVALLQEAEAARDADLGANRFAAGLFEVLMERLATNNALQAAAPADDAALREIATRRAAVAANFAPGQGPRMRPCAACSAVLPQSPFRSATSCSVPRTR